MSSKVVKTSLQEDSNASKVADHVTSHMGVGRPQIFLGEL